MSTLKEEVLASDGVHYFTKDIIRDAANHDPVDAVRDVELALMVLKSELETHFKEFEIAAGEKVF